MQVEPVGQFRSPLLWKGCEFLGIAVVAVLVSLPTPGWKQLCLLPLYVTKGESISVSKRACYCTQDWCSSLYDLYVNTAFRRLPPLQSNCQRHRSHGKQRATPHSPSRRQSLVLSLLSTRKRKETQQRQGHAEQKKATEDIHLTLI